MDKGSWVIFELPGFTKSGQGEAETSLASLRSAPGTAYFKDDKAKSLWVKLVVADAVGPGGPGGPGSGGGAAAAPGLEVSR
jgi:cell migration-inducing and hyaluronan-binding protein